MKDIIEKGQRNHLETNLIERILLSPVAWDTTAEIKRGLHKNGASLFHVVRKALEYKRRSRKVGCFSTDYVFVFLLRDTTIGEFSLGAVHTK